jgi:hypothetical protein
LLRDPDNAASYQTTVAGHHRLIEQIAARAEQRGIISTVGPCRSS